MALSTKQRAFVEHYLTCWNATQAATRAGYSHKTARSIGSENLTKPDIQAAIQARLAELQMSADEVLTRLTEHARSSMADFLEISTLGRSPVQTPPLDDDEQSEFDEANEVIHSAVSINVLQAAKRGKLHLIKRLKQGKYGIEIELYDAQAALTLLGKAQGLFKDDDSILKYIDLTKLNDDQLTRLANGDDPLAVLLNK